MSVSVLDRCRCPSMVNIAGPNDTPVSAARASCVCTSGTGSNTALEHEGTGWVLH